jgi:hypothetical protein
MTTYYAPSTGGFYDSGLIPTPPADAIEITATQYASLLAARSAGQIIEVSNGELVTVAPPPPTPTPDQVLAEKIAAGIAITCTGNATLDATYALDDVSTGQIFQIGLFAKSFGTFPSGQASQQYPDATGAMHTFTVARFVEFLTVVAPLVSNLTTQAGVMKAGGTPTWPAQTATIA